VIPEFLRALQRVLPSGNNTFTGVDEHFFPTYHLLGFDPIELDEHTPVTLADYHISQRLNPALAYFKQQPVMAGWQVLDDSQLKPNFYNLVCQPLEQHHSLHAPVLQDSRPVGMLSVFRPHHQKNFDSREQALLTCLLPYVAHALRASDDQDLRYSENGSSGMMVLDTQGKILYLSPEAKILLVLACHPRISLDIDKPKVELLVHLTQLCRNLEAISRGQHVTPPSWSHTGSNGRFNFRTYWLDRQTNEPGGLIGITIEHLEPILLKILRALQDLPLSPMQKEVALLLAQGCSTDKIGERLHIKSYTVKDHTSKIFTKLDIHHREELLPLLLARERSMAIAKGLVLR
jgi:DNA-binding CsgD family transcriptional regulator